MNNRFAIIENGRVVNTVVAEPEYAAEQGGVLCSDDAGIGWGYVLGEFVDSRSNTEPLKLSSSPTKEQLLAQLRALQTQIESLQ